MSESGVVLNSVKTDRKAVPSILFRSSVPITLGLIYDRSAVLMYDHQHKLVSGDWK